MADPNRRPPRAPMDHYLDRMIDEALRSAREAGRRDLELVPVERERPPLPPLPVWGESVDRQPTPGSHRLTAMTDRFRRMIEAYVSRQSGNA